MNFSKVIVWLYGAAFAAVTLWAVSFFVQMHRDFTTLQAQEKYLEQLRHDPALVERLIRQKLGYSKPQEFVFRFEEERR